MLSIVFFIWFFLPVALCAQPNPSKTTQDFGPTRHIFGWLETVKLLPDVVLARAKLDSSSEFSKIHGRNTKVFVRDGRKLIRFQLETKAGEIVSFEKIVARLARIKQITGNVIKLPVVSWGLCIGAVYMEVDFAVDDEEVEDYQLILGRDFLAGHAYVDPSAIYTSDPHCTFEAPLHYSGERNDEKPLS
jgi:hypothetical protein